MKNCHRIDKISLFIYMFFLLIGLLAAYYTHDFPDISISHDIGSGTFPLIFSIILSLLCICGIFKTIKSSFKFNEDFKNINKSLMAIIINALVIYFINVIGFYFSCFFFLYCLMLLLGIKRNTKIIFISIVIMILIYLIFQVLLNVPLPLGEIFSDIS